MSDTKAARLAAIRAANAQKQAGVAPAPPVDEAVAPATGATVVLTAVAPASAAAETARPARAPRAAAPAAVVAPADESAPAASLGMLVLAAVFGAFVAVFAIPNWLPGLSASLLGPEPKAYWYLARSTAFVAYGLLWLSMVLGLMMTNKLARLWPGGPVAFALHQQASILGLAFGLFHALILLGDRYSNYSLSQILVPFTSGGSAPLWVGLGQVSLYLMGLVGLSFYVRPLIGRQGWRVIHFISFVIFGLVLFHGVQSGSDSGALWARLIYWLSGGSVLYLTLYRVLSSMTQKPAPGVTQRPAPAARPAPREQIAEA
jgi:hypothetical protein